MLNFDAQVFIAIAVFIISYGIIISEKLHKTITALFGAALIVVLGIMSQEEAVRYIDFNTIGLLIGMMVLASAIKRTGMFKYIAVKVANISKGNPSTILIMFMVITGLLSAFLDNVTTIVIMIPITINICRIFGLKPVSFVIAEIFASNIGGTATLIGDPPNILIGSATHLGFNDFIINLAPVSIIALAVSILFFLKIFKNELHQKNGVQALINLDESNIITDKKLLIKSLLVLGGVILGFFLHDILHLGSATIAITGAAVILIIGKIDVKKTLEDVEWPTILFFAGLFILVGGLQKTGVLELLAKLTFQVSQGNIFITGLAILFISAILSAFIDNIPFVATMIPLIKTFGELSGSGNIDFLWWCLALGACFGGNGTIIGASANVIAIDTLKSNGYTISFKEFFKVAFPMMIITIVIAAAYMLLWFSFKQTG